jgi:choline dehydrogenase-like flavoprotein
MESLPATRQQKRLEILLKVLAVVFLLAAIGYLFLFITTPFITNSAVKVTVLALLCFIAAANINRFRAMIHLVIIGHIISEIAVAVVLILGYTDGYVSMVNPFSGAIIMNSPLLQVLWGSIVLDGVIIILLIWFYLSADKSIYQLKYLSPMQFRSLVALADVLIHGKDEKISPEEIAKNTDKYLGSFNARSKWVFKLDLAAMQIYPLLSFKPPLSYMSSDKRQKFLKDRFYKKASIVPGFWSSMIKVMIRVAKQMSYLGYYNDERTFESIGYVRFSQRNDTKDKMAANPPAPGKDLKVLTSSDLAGTEELSGDVIIIGSGAAGAILAHKLIQKGREVFMLERGGYTNPSQMNEDEVQMLSKLYSDGALQLSRDFQFQILQGSCVGGTTVVNNAVCFDLPKDILDMWNNPQLYDAGLDASKLFGNSGSFSAVRNLIRVQDQNHKNLNKGAGPFEKGIKKLGFDASPNIFHTVDANIENDCYGCGYCNIGCGFGKKLSMLDTVLPDIQEKYPDALKIIAGCEAKKIRSTGSKVTKVECVFQNGKRIHIKGKTIIVSAGAVSSSLLLLRSGIGNGRTGKNLCFNMGSPVTAVFKEKINSYEGLQISHYLQFKPNRGYIIETWFNPPVAQALTMPGWFDDHYNNMLRYDRLSCVGILVPTQANGEVRAAGLFGRDVKYVPEHEDLQKLIEGLILAGKIFLAGGAEAVLPHTWDYYEFKNENELEELRHIVKKPGDITLGTGHPQGGNAISKSKAKGVINPEFRVFGYDNFYVCDASVFPSSTGVNPQLTVMALADYAGDLIK